MTEKLKHHKKSVDENSKAWEDDKLNRQDSGRKFVEFLKSFDVDEPDQSVVIAINAEFGTGKSHFVRNLSRQLREEKYISFRLDVWDTDFSEEPLIAFIYALKEALKEQSVYSSLKQAIDQIINDASEFVLKKSSSNFARILLDLKAAGVGTIAVEGSKKIISKLKSAKKKKEFFDVSDNAVSNFELALSDRENLRKALQRIATTVDTPIIVFIDELDRCRPDYAIEFLETIKHILNIENFVFVLSTDKQQLSHSIKSVYGEGFDAIGYLRRFIDYEFSFNDNEIVSYEDYVQMRFSEFHGTDKFLQDVSEKAVAELEILSKCFGQLARCWNFTLREVNQCIQEVDIALRIGWSRDMTFLPGALAFFLALEVLSNKNLELNTPQKEAFNELRQVWLYLSKKPMVKVNDYFLKGLDFFKKIDLMDNDIKSGIMSYIIVAFITDYRGFDEERKSAELPYNHGLPKGSPEALLEKAFYLAGSIMQDRGYFPMQNSDKPLHAIRIKNMIELNDFGGLTIEKPKDQEES